MTNRTEVIKRFLKKNTVPDLAELYSYSMECQVNVSQESIDKTVTGERVQGDHQGRQWQGWTNGIEIWKPFRIPVNAKTDPHYEDSPIGWNFEKYVEGIGMTGWDWVNKQSVFVAYDFDAIIGHSDKHHRKCSEDQLSEIKDKLNHIPWVTIRYSTSGKGLHIYIFLKKDIIQINNHTEHQALARSILSMMSGLIGYDLSLKVDVAGGNMWIWHRKQINTRGLTLIKQGTELNNVPANWKDHLDVIKSNRKKNRPSFIDDEAAFEELTGQKPHILLDNEHKKLIEYLYDRYPSSSWYDADYHMLVTHTFLLKQAHQELNFRGMFETIATGREFGQDHNCFCFPIRRGGWIIRRYTMGVAEHPSWMQDGVGYTKIYYNREPDLATLARSYGGNETKSGAFVFDQIEVAEKVANILGTSLNIPHTLSFQRCRLSSHRDGRLVAEMDIDPTDLIKLSVEERNKLNQWTNKNKTWTRIFNTPAKQNASEAEVGNYDDLVRHIIEEERDVGWVVYAEGSWIAEPRPHIKDALKSLGMSDKVSQEVMGTSIFKPWVLVNQPFEPQYPGNRVWNRDSARLRYKPTIELDDLKYPTWSSILNHCGEGLNDAVKQHHWCSSNGIVTGGEYLTAWVASLLQFPMEHLPYLFFYSKEQNTGKSTFHESLSTLFDRGVINAKNSLTHPQGFNAELIGKVLCVIEEDDISSFKSSYARIKDWVTSSQLPAHPKGKTPYSVVNTTHWIQCANDPRACPIFIGDTRITMIQVPTFKPGQIIARRDLFVRLEKEASDFLAAVMNFEIPACNDRLRIPIIETSLKFVMANDSMNPLERFLCENTHSVPGESILYKDFFDKFQDSLDLTEKLEWNRHRIKKEMPPEYPIGRNRSNSQFYVGNLSWEPMNGQIKPSLTIKKVKDTYYLLPIDFKE